MAHAAIAIEGGFLSSELLDRIARGDPEIPGQKASDFGLSGRRLPDEIQSAFADAQTYWTAFRRRYERAKESKTQSARTVTRESWVDPLFERLHYKLAYQRQAVEAGGESFAISHRAGENEAAPPIHIVGFDDDIDRRDKGRRSPQATVQEYLNRSDAVWGIVTNGRYLRLLRKSAQLSRPSYMQFDLAGMFEGGLYSESVLLYRLLHRSRLPSANADPQDCLLEEYWRRCEEEGARVREGLRENVHAALETFGSALLIHPKSAELREAIRTGRLTAANYYRELLRLVYRLLFLMVAEERRLIFPVPTQEDRAGMPPSREELETLERQKVYAQYYSILRLRGRAERPLSQDRQGDLWESIKTAFSVFRSDKLAPLLGLSALNGELFGPRGCEHIEQASCRNDDVIRSLRALSTFNDEGRISRVNFGGLDVEELGSVYESLLDYHPEVGLSPEPRFELVAGSERKTTGSYYTKPELVRELIESALVPVMEERLAAAKTKADKEQAILSMRVLDPAAGSGHFLLAAARRLGRELAKIREEAEEPSPPGFRHSVRDVIRRCIYAVDKNPLAVDLCKVALWIEGHYAGFPLSFLDAHVKWGDSLVGLRDLSALAEGTPDGAYKPVADDGRESASNFKRRNKAEREADRPDDLAFDFVKQEPLRGVVQKIAALALEDEKRPEDVAAKERAYEEARANPAWMKLWTACNLWTAAFFVPLKEIEEPDGKPVKVGQRVPTTGTVWNYLRSAGSAYGEAVGQANATAVRYDFFHWPLEFPDVFLGGNSGGFDVVLGNPPWERIKLQEKEFFASRAPEIAQATSKAAREKLINELPKRRADLAREFEDAQRAAECASKFVRESERFPLCGRGDVNTYSVFAELARSLIAHHGLYGIIVPTGIATDDTTKHFFRDVVEKRSLVSLFDFENKLLLFPTVAPVMKFCLFVAGSAARPTADQAKLLFFAHKVEDLRDPTRQITLTCEDIAKLNPNTRTCPVFRSARDAEITKAIYRRVPILLREGPPEENPWGIHFSTMFHMSNDSSLFRTREQLEADGFLLEGNVFRGAGDSYLPLYEAKLFHQFNHRAGTFDGTLASGRFKMKAATIASSSEQLADAQYSILPRFWLRRCYVDQALSSLPSASSLLAFRGMTNVMTNSRNAVFSVLPRVAVGNSAPICILKHSELMFAFLAAVNSFVFDYITRQKLAGANMNFFIVNQLPVLPPPAFARPCPWSGVTQRLADWLSPRVLELTYTSWDCEPGREYGWVGPPFRWDEDRRFVIRCELDAAFLHLYGICRDDADYIFDTFPIVKRKDQEHFGEYRTKRVILEVYDEMARAGASSRPYETRLDPPPGDPRAAHKPAQKRRAADGI